MCIIYNCARPEGECFILYTYRIRHDLCNLCHRGMPSEVLHFYMLHEVRKLVVICGLYKLFC